MSIPVVLILKMRRNFNFFFLFIASVFVGMYLVFHGMLLNNSLLSNEVIALSLFYICLIIITIPSLVFLYFGCKEGIHYALSKNEWDHMSDKAGIFIRILLIVAFLFFPSLVFSYLYALWFIPLYPDAETLQIGDALYYAISVVYSLPQTGVFTEFQHLVNSHIILRIIEIAHVISTRLVEFMVIGLILGHTGGMLLQKKDKNKAIYRKRFLDSASIRRRIG